ncbi:MAG: AzlD domain-containing protein [Clostridia bacterium]|nr:AzlD domain-containing protein [Clostridia bacterium]
MRHNTWIYLLIMALVSYVIRALPLTLIRRPIRNRTLRSFLYYVPYVTLAVMTFPAIMDATGNVWSGLAALAAGALLAWLGGGLLPVAILCCATVFLMNLFL